MMTKKSHSDLERQQIEFLILGPIAQRLCPQLWRSKDQFSMVPSQIQGTIIAEIGLLTTKLKRQRASILSLRRKLETEKQLTFSSFLSARREEEKEKE